MKKRIVAIVLFVAMLLGISPLDFAVPAFADASGTCGDNLRWNYNSTTFTLTISGTGKMTDYPQYSTPWYGYRSQVKVLTIEDGIEHIGEFAFNSFNNITSITIPESVTSIGIYAFNGCDRVNEINYNAINVVHGFLKDDKQTIWNVLGDNSSSIAITVGENVEIIPEGLFVMKNAKKIKTAVLGNNVRKIGQNAFAGCSGLTNIILPEALEEIGHHAFSGCSGITEITLPDSLRVIGYRSFYKTGLTSITIPEGVTYIGGNAFDDTPFINNNINYTNNLLYSGKWLLKALNRLSGSCQIMEGTRGIAGAAFNNCVELTDVMIPESVTSIGDNAFAGCTKLTNINLPSDIKTIDNYTFFQCSNLINITVPDGVTTIGLFAFYGCRQLTNINIPESVTVINSRAFQNCSALENITIGNNVTSIGSEAFLGCSQLTNITIGDNVTHIDSDAFKNTGYYNNEDNWEEGLLYIDTYLIGAKQDMVGFCEIKPGTTIIAVGAFYNCISITSIVIPAGIKNISASALGNCTGLTKITIPVSMESIDYRAFYNCSALTDVYYYGTEAQWNNIEIDVLNESIFNATIHYYVEVSIKPAECEASGLTEYSYWSNTDPTEYIVEPIEIPPLGHDWYIPTSGFYYIIDKPFNKEATCTNDGCKRYRCRNKITHYYDEIVPATGHTPSAVTIENNVNVTCTTDGRYDNVVYCSTCGEELSRETIIVPMTGHSPAEAVREKEIFACTQDGQYDSVVYCSVCGEELSRETIDVPMTGHIPAEAVKENEIAATCSEDGSYESVIYCSICGEKLSGETVVIKAAHTPADAVTENEVAETCIENGSYDTVVYCSVCGDELSRETITVNAKGHNPSGAVTENEVKATCTESGSYDSVIYCSVCGDELSRETFTENASGHSFTNYVSNNDATCLQDGTKTAKCDNCEETDTIADEGSALGHALIHHTGKASTCKEKGYADYDTCSRCDYTTYSELPLADHTPAPAVRENTVAATCTENGSYDSVIYCSVCEEELSREKQIEKALGHNIIHHIGKPSTCKVKGYAAYDTCSRCDYTTYSELPLADHTPATAVKENTVASTCTENGSYDSVVYCSVCGKELSRKPETTVKTGHKDKNNDGVCDICGTVTDTAKHNAYLLGKAKINVKSSATVDYRSTVTVTATASGLPEGYVLALYEGSSLKAKGSATSVSYNAGELMGNKTFTVKVVDSGNTPQKDSSGKEVNKTVEVKVKSGFFDKLIAFFRNLFGSLPKVEIKP